MTLNQVTQKKNSLCLREVAAGLRRGAANDLALSLVANRNRDTSELDVGIVDLRYLPGVVADIGVDALGVGVGDKGRIALDVRVLDDGHGVGEPLDVGVEVGRCHFGAIWGG